LQRGSRLRAGEAESVLPSLLMFWMIHISFNIGISHCAQYLVEQCPGCQVHHNEILAFVTVGLMPDTTALFHVSSSSKLINFDLALRLV
jgi:hypothetical protein